MLPLLQKTAKFRELSFTDLMDTNIFKIFSSSSIRYINVPVLIIGKISIFFNVTKPFFTEITVIL